LKIHTKDASVRLRIYYLLSHINKAGMIWLKQHETKSEIDDDARTKAILLKNAHLVSPTKGFQRL